MALGLRRNQIKTKVIKPFKFCDLRKKNKNIFLQQKQWVIIELKKEILAASRVTNTKIQTDQKTNIYFLRETCSHNPSRFNLSSAKFDRWRASFNLSFSDRQFMQWEQSCCLFFFILYARAKLNNIQTVRNIYSCLRFNKFQLQS